MATVYQTAAYTDPHWDAHLSPSFSDASYDQPHLYDHDPHSNSSTNGYRSDNGLTKYNSLPREITKALYGQRGGGTLGKKRSMGSVLDPDNVDRDAWIHRDKLAQIESMEMARAGITVRQPSRNRDHGSQSRSRSRSQSRAGGGKAPPAHEVYTLQKSASEPLASYEQQFDEEDDPMDYDPAMLIPVASVERSQLSQNKHYASANSRSATSRIPVLRASPTPLPRPVVERDAPLPRSRAGSSPKAWNGHSEDPASLDRRSRSQSLGSQAMLDDAIAGAEPSPERGRPASSKRASPAGSMSGQQNNSTPNKPVSKAPVSSVSSRRAVPNQAANGSAQSRVVSASKTSPASPGLRPGSSASPSTRPKTGTKRPEGDAPWLATMYKPDPRLPPDQQLLPTHAKRMLQEEPDVKTAVDFNVLDDAELAKMGAFPDPTPMEEKGPDGDGPGSPQAREAGAEAAWPLRGDSRPNLHKGVSTGGYRTTPSIPRPGSSGRQSTRRMPDLDEKSEPKKKKESGCCCIVM